MSHILCYVWMFFRMIMFYLALLASITALNVIQMKLDHEWRRLDTMGEMVFAATGVLDPLIAYRRWQTVLFSYIPLLLIYCWAMVVVGVYVCNLMEEFRRGSWVAVAGATQEGMRRLSEAKKSGTLSPVQTA